MQIDDHGTRIQDKEIKKRSGIPKRVSRDLNPTCNILASIINYCKVDYRIVILIWLLQGSKETTVQQQLAFFHPG